MQSKKPQIKPREIVMQALSKRDEEAIHLLSASVDEMLKIWSSSNIPSGLSKKRFQVSN